MVRPTNKTFDTDSFDKGGWEGFLDMTAEAPGERSIEIAGAGREFSDNAAYEAFMTEPVGIRIAQANNPREMPTVPVGVNGNQRWLPRDVPVMIRRFHLERLTRCTQTTFSVQSLSDPALDEGHRVRNSNQPVYHIEVIKDDNPKGAAWMSRMRREGC